MLHFKYPSKEFDSAWRNAVENAEEFEVDARINTFIINSLKYHIDSVFGHPHPRSWLGALPAGFFAGNIMVCIAVAYYRKKYDAEYSETKGGLLITFRRM